MLITSASPENIAELVRYCRQYGKEHDESFLPDETFAPTDDYPAYLLYTENGIAGAVGLLRSEPYRRLRKARFMIFHAIEPSLAAYEALLAAVRPHLADVDYVYGFIPEERAETRRCWEALGFYIERFSYLLTYSDPQTPEVHVPEGYRLEALERDDTAAIRELCDLWNANYAHTPGAMGARPEYIAEAFDAPEYLPGGVLLLRYGEQPVGTAYVGRDNEDAQAAWVELLSVHPEHRGRGLGRLLLRRTIQVSRRHGLPRVGLNVNAENESAVALYLSEGFVKDTVMVCYRLEASCITKN